MGKKIQLIKRLTNQGYNLQVMAANALKEFLASERAREEAERLEFERQQKEKDRILRRIMDSNVRMMGVGFRQAYQWMEHDREKERILMLKQRGIMRRIVDKNARMVSAGYNKLIEEWKVRQNTLKEKLKFVIKALTDKDAAYILAGYNGLKEFLASERAREEAERLEFERQQKEKDRILRRIMDGNVRMMGTGFRQAFQWMEKSRDEERRLMQRQRGIMRRIVDSNTRLMSAGYNKLIEEWKARGNMLKEKLRFVIKSLTDKDTAYILAGYNGLKQRALML